jgi:glycosyltransferase involved in cell wall biosynthesis
VSRSFDLGHGAPAPREPVSPSPADARNTQFAGTVVRGSVLHTSRAAADFSWSEVSVVSGSPASAGGRPLSPEIAVIVSTFERPSHLERCLASLEAQRDVEGQFEVVVTDDGSGDGTRELLIAASSRTPYPFTFTTHEHHGFRLARCRNAGVAASTAPYLLFTDGDCILPPDHLRTHLAARQPGRIVAGDCLRLDAPASNAVDAAALRAGRFPLQVSPREHRRLLVKGWRAKLYETLRVPRRPRLTGNNIGVWRSDFEAVNGFDEQYVGWGFEDLDLQARLERLGLRAWSILLETAPVHLWHPPAPSFARNGVGTANLDYFRDVGRRPMFCVDGLVKASDDVRHDAPPVSLSYVEAARLRRIYSLGNFTARKHPA